MLSRHRSKKQSETGEWTDDSERTTCELCSAKFSVTKRRHHCRKCGKLICGSCSAHKMYLDISRSGKAKRVCNECFNAVMGDGKEEAEGAATAETAEAAPDAAEGGGAGAGAAGAAAGAGAGAAADGSAPSGPAESAATAKPKFAVMEIPDVPTEEAVEALASTEFAGEWNGVMQFLEVDIGSQRKDAVVSGLNVGSFGPRGGVMGRGGRGGARRRRSSTNNHSVREGSRLRINMELVKKSAGYFNGTLSSLGQFGKEGKITGSLQRGTGKVSMQVQIKNFGTTTSFNFIGHVTASKELVGTFSGCEISKTAGSVSGVFKASAAVDGSDSDE